LKVSHEGGAGVLLGKFELADSGGTAVLARVVVSHPLLD
jgi:hypothetical protein